MTTIRQRNLEQVKKLLIYYEEMYKTDHERVKDTLIIKLYFHNNTFVKV